MIDRYLSDKIKLLSLFSMFLVLYIHSGFHNYPHEILGMKFNNVLQSCISEKIGRCAVPIFYMISGFLFFQNTENGISSIFIKMKKRIRTLIIPYIIGCLFFPLFFIILIFIPGSDKFMNGGNDILSLFEQPFYEIISSIFYKKPDGTSPLAFQLWFLRDLIIIVLISPVIYLLRKHINKYVLILCTLCLSLFEGINAYFPFLSLFWFLLGDCLFNKINNSIFIYVYMIISSIEVYFSFTFPTYINTLVTIIGVFGILSIYNVIVPQNYILKHNKYLFLACNTTFFIYLFHEPTLNIIRKLLVKVLGQSSVGFAFSYLLSPWVFTVAAIFISLLMRRYIPKVYSVLVGGR